MRAGAALHVNQVDTWPPDLNYLFIYFIYLKKLIFKLNRWGLIIIEKNILNTLKKKKKNLNALNKNLSKLKINFDFSKILVHWRLRNIVHDI